eukprot:2114303-Amphidinium_carterae.2
MQELETKFLSGRPEKLKGTPPHNFCLSLVRHFSLLGSLGRVGVWAVVFNKDQSLSSQNNLGVESSG